MKKVFLFVFLFLFLTSQNIESKEKELRFVIYFDSKEENLIQRKNEILTIFNDAMSQLSDESIHTLLIEDIQALENEDRKVMYRQSTLYFYLGDSQGIRIEGNLYKNSFCMVEVKPKSFLRKWLGF